MSDTNRVGVAIARNSESVFPTAITTLNKMRITGTPNLAFDPLTEVSAEIRDDRQVSDLIPIGAEAGGDVGFEFSYGVVDDILESALLGTWDDTTSATPDAGAMGAGTIPFAATAGFITGQIVRLIDPSVFPAGEGDTSGLYVVVTVTLNTNITVTPVLINTYDASYTDATAITAAFESDASTIVKVVGFAAATADIAYTATGITSAAGIFDDFLRDGVAKDLAPGHFIRLIGSDVLVATTNDVFIEVTAVTAAGAGLTFDVPTNWQTDPGTGDDVLIFFGDVLINPATPVALSSRQFAVERSFNDHTPIDRELFLEMGVNTMVQTLAPQAIAVGTVGFFGTTALAASQTDILNLYTGGDPARVDAPAFDVYNTSSNVARLARGGNRVGAGGVNCVVNASVNINNNMRRQNAVGVFGACGIGLGEFSVTGDLETYFDDLSLYNDVLAGNETSLDITMRGNDGRTLLTALPRIKFTGGAPQVPGKNADVLLPLAYQALLDADLGYTLSYQRFTFAP